jgi:hypothetical protein
MVKLAVQFHLNMDLNGFSLGVPVDCPLRLSLGLQYMFVLTPRSYLCFQVVRDGKQPCKEVNSRLKTFHIVDAFLAENDISSETR